MTDDERVDEKKDSVKRLSMCERRTIQFEIETYSIQKNTKYNRCTNEAESHRG
jgi:hypothetical protein